MEGLLRKKEANYNINHTGVEEIISFYTEGINEYYKSCFEQWFYHNWKIKYQIYFNVISNLKILCNMFDSLVCSIVSNGVLQWEQGEGTKSQACSNYSLEEMLERNWEIIISTLSWQARQNFNVKGCINCIKQNWGNSSKTTFYRLFLQASIKIIMG